jgi:hypothetical protein
MLHEAAVVAPSQEATVVRDKSSRADCETGIGYIVLRSHRDSSQLVFPFNNVHAVNQSDSLERGL